MKSLQQRMDEKLIKEFVGPLGQTDPMAQTSQQKLIQEPKLQQDNQQNDDLPLQIQNLLKRLSTKSAQQIIQIQQNLNNSFQQLLANKSRNAERKGLWSQYNQSRINKQNWSNNPNQ